MTPSTTPSRNSGHSDRLNNEQTVQTSQGRQKPPAPFQLWNKDEGIVDRKLYSEVADKWALLICEEGQEKWKDKDKIKVKQKRNKQSQLRRFYDEVIRLNDMANNRIKPRPMSLILPALHMLIAKASYAKGRDLVTDSFVNLIKQSIVPVETKEDLQVFSCFFEAFMAFYKLYDPKN